MSKLSLQELEELECHYLNKYYHFLKFAEDEMLYGFKTKYDIKEDWYPQWNPKKEGKGISDFATGAERIIYALLNGKGIGQPNSAPIGSDLFFETENAYVHIDLKTVQTRNIDDYLGNIFVGNSQNSYKGELFVSGIKKKYDLASLPTYYTKRNGTNVISKPCLTYFITILYEEINLEILVICIVCMPNGELYEHYKERVLSAGKVLFKVGDPLRETHAKSVRFNWEKTLQFELLESKPSRVKVVYLKNEVDEDLKEKLNIFSKIVENGN